MNANHPSDHHPRGMSKWPALLTCPRYISGEGGLDAEIGTKNHEDLSGFLVTLSETGKLPEIDASASIFEKGAYIAAKTVRDMAKAECVPFKAIHSEYRCELPNGVFGTADVVWVNRLAKRVTVCDYKTFQNKGRDYTPQLAGYALAVHSKLHWTPTEYRLVILYGDSHKATEISLNYGQCKDIFDRAMKAFDAQESGEQGEPVQSDWCTLCKFADSCPAFRQIAKTVSESSDLANAAFNWKTIPVEKKAQLMVLADTVSKWADGIKKAARADLIAGKPIEDEDNAIRYVLRSEKGAAHPRVPDVIDLLKDKGYSEKDALGFTSITKKSLEGALKAKGLSAKEIAALIEDVSDLGDSKVKMVRG